MTTWWSWGVLVVAILLVGGVACRVAWVLWKRRPKAPRNDIYPLW